VASISVHELGMGNGRLSGASFRAAVPFNLSPGPTEFEGAGFEPLPRTEVGVAALLFALCPLSELEDRLSPEDPGSGCS
jgi:hypothetical protein